MNNNELKYRIENDDDFIYYPKFNNSLTEMLKKYPDGIENSRIAKLLLMEESEVEAIYENAIIKLRKALGVE
jgi:hypothetical protein